MLSFRKNKDKKLKKYINRINFFIIENEIFFF